VVEARDRTDEQAAIFQQVSRAIQYHMGELAGLFRQIGHKLYHSVLNRDTFAILSFVYSPRFEE
jgi:hypothetical protein